MGDHGFADVATAVHDVHHAGRQRPGHDGEEACDRQGCQRRRLDDHGVAGKQGRCDLEAGQDHRGVPRRDGADDAVGLPCDAQPPLVVVDLRVGKDLLGDGRAVLNEHIGEADLTTGIG